MKMDNDRITAELWCRFDFKMAVATVQFCFRFRICHVAFLRRS